MKIHAQEECVLVFFRQKLVQWPEQFLLYILQSLAGEVFGGGKERDEVYCLKSHRKAVGKFLRCKDSYRETKWISVTSIAFHHSERGSEKKSISESAGKVIPQREISSWFGLFHPISLFLKQHITECIGTIRGAFLKGWGAFLSWSIWESVNRTV